MLLGAGGAVASDSYPIKLFRPSHVGDTYDWKKERSIQSRETVTMDGQQPVVQDHVTKLRLECRVTVQAVDKNGEKTEVVCAVHQCVVSTDGAVIDLLPAGAVLTAKNNNGNAEYASKDGELTKKQISLLGMLVRFSSKDDPTLDEEFPTSAPLGVGARWDADIEKMAGISRRSGATVDNHDLSGEAVFLSIEKVKNDPCMKIRIAANMHNAHQKLEPGLTTDIRDQVMLTTLVLPVDPTRRSVAQASETHKRIDQTGKSADGKPFERHLTMTDATAQESSDP